MKERKTLKEVYSQHKWVILTIALFISGYLVSWKFMEKPLNNSQFELCEQVARDVYAQKGNVIVEVPEDFFVSMTTTTITVRLANKLYIGEVIAKLQNGELVMTRDMETERAVLSRIVTGGAFVIVGIVLIFLGACAIQEKIKR